MNRALTPLTILLLVLPPIMWSGNAVIGRYASDLIPPMLLSFLRWSLALTLLAPFGFRIWRRGSPLWARWRRYAVLGLLGTALYNGVQYLALHTTTPLNMTLIGGSLPFWMLLVGALFFKTRVQRGQVLAAVLSMLGVVVVLSQGDPTRLMALDFVRGDLYTIGVTLAWVVYSWLLSKGGDPEPMRGNWLYMAVAQMTFGVAWAGLFAALEWAVSPPMVIEWNGQLLATLLYVAIGPAIVALTCWNAGVRRVGASTAGFFSNLTPVFTALLSALFLGERAQLYHGVAFALIVAGIWYSSRGAR